MWRSRRSASGEGGAALSGVVSRARTSACSSADTSSTRHCCQACPGVPGPPGPLRPRGW